MLMNSSNSYCDAPVWDEQTERSRLLFDIELHRPLDSPADVNPDGSLKKRTLVEMDRVEPAVVATPQSLSISVEPGFGTRNGAYTPVPHFQNYSSAANHTCTMPPCIRLEITHALPQLNLEFKPETSLFSIGASKFESSAAFAINVATSSSSSRARALLQQRLQPICNSWDAARCNVQHSASAVGTDLPTRCICLTVSLESLQMFQHLAVHVEAAQEMGPDSIIRIESRSCLLSPEHIVSFIELCRDWSSAAAEFIPAVSLFAAAHAFGHAKAATFARRKLLEGSRVPMMALPDVLVLSLQANDVEVIGHCFLACTFLFHLLIVFSCLTSCLSSAVRFASNQHLLYVVQRRYTRYTWSHVSRSECRHGHSHLCRTDVAAPF